MHDWPLLTIRNKNTNCVKMRWLVSEIQVSNLLGVNIQKGTLKMALRRLTLSSLVPYTSTPWSLSVSVDNKSVGFTSTPYTYVYLATQTDAMVYVNVQSYSF